MTLTTALEVFSMSQYTHPHQGLSKSDFERLKWGLCVLSAVLTTSFVFWIDGLT